MTNDRERAFAAMTADPRYLANLDSGKPRRGHPEGTIRAHIAELEQNLQTFRGRLCDEEYWKLRLLIHAHDTFKPVAREDAPIRDPASHASLARAFLAEFVPADDDLLAMVQWHDEPYALFRQSQRRGHYDVARFDALLSVIREWDVFLAFLIIDGCTVGKPRRPLQWWFQEIEGRAGSRFTIADIPS